MRRYHSLPIFFLLVSLAFVAVAFMHGCAELGGRADVTDTRSGILEAKAIGKAYTLAIQDLLRTGVINSDQARKQLETLRTAALTLKSTNALIETDPAQASNRLIEVRTTLQTVLTFLVQFEGNSQ